MSDIKLIFDCRGGDVDLCGVCDNDLDVKKIIRQHIKNVYPQYKRNIGYPNHYDVKFDFTTRRYYKSEELKIYDICSAMRDMVSNIRNLKIENVKVNEAVNINIQTY